MLVGYARVSTVDQNPGYQLRALEERGCGKIFVDHCSCRRSAVRPQLRAALDFLREGDTLAVWKFDRVARRTSEMLALAADLKRRGCGLVSLTEAIDTTSPGGQAVFTVMAAFAQLEADLAAERVREAYAARKAAGGPWGRRSAFSDPATVRKAKAMLADPSLSRREVAETLGVSTTTLYNWFPGGDPARFTGRYPGRFGEKLRNRDKAA